MTSEYNLQHNEHDHSHHNFKIGLKSGLAIAGALATSAVMLSPDLLPDILDKFDLGSEGFKANANDAANQINYFCHNSETVGATYSALGDAVSSVPIIGEKLAEGTMATPLIGTGLIIAAKPTMDLAKKATYHIMAFDDGKLTKIPDSTAQNDDTLTMLTTTLGEWAMKGAGMAMILYTALPAIGHGIGYLMLTSELGGPPPLDTAPIINILEETGSTAPWHHQMMMSNQGGVDSTGVLSAVTAAAAPHLPCFAAIAGASGSYILDSENKHSSQSDKEKLANKIAEHEGYEHTHIEHKIAMGETPNPIISNAEHMHHNHSGMIQGESPIIASITPATKLQPFTKNERTLKLNWLDNGNPITTDELEILHTEPVHMFINNPTMSDYHHIHPQPTNIAGEYSFSITPTTADAYRSWLDIKPKGQDGGIFQVKQDMLGNNKITPIQSFKKPAKLEQYSSMQNGKDTLIQTLNIIGDSKVGNQQTAILNIKRASGEPVILQDIMEAKAHLVGFCPDYQTLLHTHPEGEPTTTQFPKEGVNLSFHFTSPMEGSLKLFSQILIDGQEYLSGFDVPIKAQQQSKVR